MEQIEIQEKELEKELEKVRNGLYILGAEDVEMVYIRKILEKFGCKAYTALGASGNVTPREAARGEWYVNVSPYWGQLIVLLELTPNDQIPVWVEKFDCSYIVLDHHKDGDPPMATLSQLAILLLLGRPGLAVALADHDLKTAYKHLPLWVWQVRRGHFKWSKEELHEAQKFVDQMEPAPLKLRLWISKEKSPNNATADLLMYQQRAGLIEVPSDKEGTRKFVLSGFTTEEHVNWLLKAAKKKNWEAYGFAARGLGGVYVPPGHELMELFEETD